MSDSDVRSFELTTTVHFPTIKAHRMEDFARKLDIAVNAVLREYPAVTAYLVERGAEAGDISFGLRFEGANPRYMEDMADEVLEKAVDSIAAAEGTSPLKAEREESTLIHA